MKKSLKKIFTVTGSIFLLSILSCASAPEKANNADNTKPEVSEQNINSENDEEKSEEIIPEEEAVDVIEQVVLTPEEEFLLSIQDIKLEFIESPKETTAGKNFASPYKIEVTKNGNPLADYQFIITYPKERPEDKIIFEQELVSTASDGIYTFTPSAPVFAANTTVSASLYTDLNSEEIISAVNGKTVSAEYKVKSNTIQKGCLLFVWEYNEKDKALNNFNDLQSSLRKRSISICGNAPVNEKTDISKSLKTLYKENYEIVEDMYGYLIVGTVKYTKPVALTEDKSGYLCSLIAEISAVDMKTGKKVFDQQFTQEAIGSNWTKATSSCKTAIADKIVDALIYGL